MVIFNGYVFDVFRYYGVSSTILIFNLNFIFLSKGNYVVVNIEVGFYKEMFLL